MTDPDAVKAELSAMLLNNARVRLFYQRCKFTRMMGFTDGDLIHGASHVIWCINAKTLDPLWLALFISDVLVDSARAQKHKSTISTISRTETNCT